MAEGASTTLVNQILDATYGGSFYTTPYVQLHTAAPGAAGTASVAGNSTRKALTCAAAASGSKASSADLVWTSVSTAETYTKQSNWSAATAGTFISSGSVTASAVAVGDTFTISSGSWTASMPVAA